MRLPIMLIVLLLCSCKELNLEKVDENALVEDELKSINWNSVDQYPSFASCDSVTQQTTEQCFKNTLIRHVNGTLSQANIVVTEDLEDTLMLKLQISAKGQISIEHIEAKPQSYEAIPELDSLLAASIRSLPTIYPAIKRGQQVTTEFQLPIVVSIR